MAATSLKLISGSKSARDKSFGKFEQDVRWKEQFIEQIRRIWPTKTSHHLAASAHVSQRQAEFWLAGQREISVELARALIQSEDGFEFLAAFMGDANPRWWKRVRHSYEIGQFRRTIKESEKRLAMLKQGELDL